LRLSEDPRYTSEKAHNAFVEAIIKQIRALKRSEGAPITNALVWDVAIIEPNWNEPRVFWTT
jgi:hypothetical protein